MEDTPRIVETRRLRDAWSPISEDRVVLPSGATREWIRLHFGTSAGILPVTGDRRILLTREYGHGLRRIAFSLPGGIAKDGESAEARARRDLLEETGHAGSRMIPLYEGNNLTAYLEGSLHLFVADGWTPTGGPPSPDEIRSVERLRVSDVLGGARRGEFESSVLSLAVLLADARGFLPV